MLYGGGEFQEEAEDNKKEVEAAVNAAEEEDVKENIVSIFSALGWYIIQHGIIVGLLVDTKNVVDVSKVVVMNIQLSISTRDNDKEGVEAEGMGL